MSDAPTTQSSHEQPPMSVSTEPLSPGGTNFRTARLHIAHPELAKVKPSIYMWLVAGMLAALDAAIATKAVEVLVRHNTLVGVVMLVLALILAAPLLLIGRHMVRSAVFDRRSGTCRVRASRHSVSSRQRSVNLDDVAGLQLIAEWLSSSRGPGFYSYELNLVLHQGERLPVMDHGNLPAIVEDAHKLADFLGKPVWNQIDETR